tara:strand:- start:1346 stop:1993 length:648 start_codon:yes stop_codon:yes gene_type:complete
MTESEIGLAIAGTKAAAGMFAAFQANKAKGDAKDQETIIENLEQSRQAIINPYTGITNPYANLSVATQAAEMQAEQSDLALATTLDNLRQTGAGGATALAQAALKSKQGVSATLETQEANNEKLRAQGELQAQRMEAAGKQFVFGQQEAREIGQLDRAQSLLENAQAQQMASRGQGIGALVSGLNTLANVEDLGSVFGGGDGGNDVPMSQPSGLQ